MKHVTWADGSRETIEITDKGHIYLNAREVKAFGYCVAYGTGLVSTYGKPTEALAERAFGWLQSKGVRFIHLTADKWEGSVQFWMKYCYKYKMFVHYVIGNNPSKDIDVDHQYNWFKSQIDIISSLPQEYANSVYAVMLPCWELNIFYDYDTLDRYLTELYPLCKSYLQASKIGDVPLTAKTSHGIFYEPSYAIVKHSDIPCWDAYPRMPNPIDDFNWCMNKIRNEVLPATGKTGYQIWLTEHGVGIDKPGLGLSSGNVDPGYPPELLNQILAQPEISSVAMWALHYWDEDECNDWGAFFQGTGEPKQWTGNLVAQFPR